MGCANSESKELQTRSDDSGKNYSDTDITGAIPTMLQYKTTKPDTHSFKIN